VSITRRTLTQALSVTAAATGVTASALLAAIAIAGRALPWEMTRAHAAAFGLVATTTIVLAILTARCAATYDRSVMPRMLWPHLGCISLLAYVYTADIQALQILDSLSARVVMLSTLILATGFGLRCCAGNTTSPWMIRIRTHTVAFGDLLITVASSLALTDLLLKVALGDHVPPVMWVWALAVCLLLIPWAVIRIDASNAWTRRPWSGLLFLPTLGAVLTHIESPARHFLITSGGAKSLTLLLIILGVYAVWIIRAGYIENPLRDRERLAGIVRSHRTSLIMVTLLGVGGLQASSYIAITADDLIRYWTVTDSLATGQGYPLTVGSIVYAQDGSWAEPPLFPLVIWLSFLIADHYYDSVLLPGLAAVSLLPVLTYLALWEASKHRAIAFFGSVLIIVFPPYQIHLLGTAEPDPIFSALLALTAWLFLRAVRPQAAKFDQGLLGLSLAAVTMTRPEGLAYVAVLTLAAVLIQRRRATWFAAAIPVVVVALFAGIITLTTDATWPTRPSGISATSLETNLRFAFDGMWSYYVRVLLIDDLRSWILLSSLALLFVIGIARGLRGRIALAVLPIAAVTATLGPLAAEPIPPGWNQPTEAFRHFAHGLPLIATTIAAGTAWVLERRIIARPTVQAVAVLMAISLIAAELYILATPEEFYHGNQSGSLLRGGDIYVQAIDLFRHRIVLPCWSCGDPPNYMLFRQTLFSNYQPFDMHSSTVGQSYQVLTAILVGTGAFATMVGNSDKPRRIPPSKSLNRASGERP